MVRYAARRGVKALGVTLSKEQAEWAQKAIVEEGLSDLAEVRHSDYRDVPEEGFDAISSIGLTEHIGVANYPAYFRFLHGKLRVGGLLLNHCITRPTNNTRAKPAFIDRYVFPDGELTGSGRIITEAQNIGFEVMHEENLREHYALTLKGWCEYLEKHWQACVAEVGEGTARLWGLYMAGSRLGFERNVVQLHQCSRSSSATTRSRRRRCAPGGSPSRPHRHENRRARTGRAPDAVASGAFRATVVCVSCAATPAG